MWHNSEHTTPQMWFVATVISIVLIGYVTSGSPTAENWIAHKLHTVIVWETLFRGLFEGEGEKVQWPDGFWENVNKNVIIVIVFYYEHTFKWTQGRIANAYAGANSDPK